MASNILTPSLSTPIFHAVSDKNLGMEKLGTRLTYNNYSVDVYGLWSITSSTSPSTGKVPRKPAKRRLPTDQGLETQKSALEGPFPRRLGKGFLPATCAMPFRPVCPLGPPRTEAPIPRRLARPAMCPTKPLCPLALTNIVGGGVVCSMCGQEMRLPVDDNGECVVSIHSLVVTAC